jgi:tetratricopeptide (TPR) repeat protein
MTMPLCRRSLAAAAVLAVISMASGQRLSAQQTQSAPSTNAPDPKAPASKPADPKTPAKTPDADENAFPEAQSEAAQKQATENESADRKAAASGSAVAPGSPENETGSSSRDKLKGMDLLGDNESRIANGAGGTVVDPKLAAQDLKVGQQYMGMGDYAGAYGRFKEACTVNPGNVEAVFYLAEAARKTAHLDESAENYRIYLQVQPDGPKAKAARKALAQLQGK